MPFPFLEVGGLAAGIGGQIFQAQAAKKRFNAMKTAAQRLQAKQDNDYNTALLGIRGAQSAWETDPAQAQIRSMWEQRLANPSVVGAGDLSNLKQQALSSAGSESAGAITASREQAQRAGLGGSRAGMAGERAIRAGAFGKAAGISTGLDMEAAKANRTSQDAVRSGYSEYAAGNNATRFNFAQAISNLIGSRQYGESALLAAM